MNVAILTLSFVSAAASLASLAVVGKIAYEMHAAKTEIDANIEDVKAKVARNAKVVKAALTQIEL